IFIGLSAIFAARIVRPPFRYLSVVLSPLAGRARVVHRERGPRTRARRDGTDDRLADLGLGNRLRGIPVRLIVSGSGPRRVTLRPRMLNLLDLASIEAARKRIEGLVVRTPLVRLNVDDAPA